jgi:Leucine-rich repeat (LRR) protein
MIKYLTYEGKIIEEKYDEKTTFIDLSFKSIKLILKTYGLANLRKLHLNDNEITEITGLDGLTSLEDLLLNNNKITEIKGIYGLTSLENLSLYRNQITEIKGIDGLTSLENLSLYSNQITEIKGLYGLTNLQYLSLHNNQITEMKGLDGLTRLQILLLSDNQIKEIKGLDDLTSLRELSLSYNQITKIKGLDRLISLRELSLSYNEITKIKGLDRLSRLKKLWLHNNQITEMKGLYGLTSLKNLSLSNNQIKEMKGLYGLTNLQYLSLENNQITQIKGLDGLTRLRELLLHSNQITKIEGLDGLTNLQEIWLYDNQITNIPFSIMNNINLNTLDIDCDIDPIIQRFLDRNVLKDNKTIYDDTQNVHNSHIVETIKQSIYNIIGDSTPGNLYGSTKDNFQSKEISIDLILKNIINDKILDKTTKQQLIEYCQDKTVHSLLNLTFDEVLCSVWKIISEHKESNEIKKILNEEMKDSMCKCFTGRLSRLVNCLNGFDSRVSIKINDKEQILNVIIKIRNKYSNNIEKQKEEVIKELLERGYDKNTINEYIIYLE